MKKILFVMVVLVATTTAKAGDFMRWGFEGGLNVNSLSFSSSTFSSENRLGFFIGPKAQFKVPLLGFGVDVAVDYSLKGMKLVPTEGEAVSKNQSYLEIPLNIRYDFNAFKLLGFYLATGPQYNCCLSSLQEGQNRSDWGWNVGAGLTLFNHLQVGASYTFGMGSSFDMKNIDFSTRTAKVRVAYMF